MCVRVEAYCGLRRCWRSCHAETGARRAEIADGGIQAQGSELRLVAPDVGLSLSLVLGHGQPEDERRLQLHCVGGAEGAFAFCRGHLQ